MNPMIAGELSVEELIESLKLQPHPEGGFYREIYRADEAVDAVALPSRYGAARCSSTSIYYLLTADTFSTMHTVKSDEMLHFYMGDPVEQLRLFPDGRSEVVILGQNIRSGQHIQSLAPRAVWQGSRLVPGGKYALLGCTVAPGFDFADYEEGECTPLTKAFPQHASLIYALTRR